ncbi:hypothetical protein ACFFGM_05215 [Asaia krungthepensis]
MVRILTLEMSLRASATTGTHARYAKMRDALAYHSQSVTIFD